MTNITLTISWNRDAWKSAYTQSTRFVVYRHPLTLLKYALSLAIVMYSGGSYRILRVFMHPSVINYESPITPLHRIIRWGIRHLAYGTEEGYYTTGASTSTNAGHLNSGHRNFRPRNWMSTLWNQHDGHENLIGYWSRLLTEAERTYNTSHQECITIVWAVLLLGSYPESTSLITWTDCKALKGILNLADDTDKLAQWLLQLSNM